MGEIDLNDDRTVVVVPWVELPDNVERLEETVDGAGCLIGIEAV